MLIGIAGANKMGGFDGCIDIDATRQHHRLVGDDPDHPAVQARETDHHVFRPQSMDLKESSVVYQAGDHLAHIVRFMRRNRHDLLQLRAAPACIIRRLDVRRIILIVRRQIAQ